MRGHHRVVVQPMLWRCGRPLGRSMLLRFFRLGPTCARRAVSSLSKARNKTDKLHFHRGIEDLCSRCEFDFPPSWNLCQPDLKTMHLSHSLVTEDLDLRPLPCEMAKTYHPQSIYRSLKKRSSERGLLRMSAFCSVVRQYVI